MLGPLKSHPGRAPFTHGLLQASQARAWLGAWLRYAPVYTYRGRAPRQLNHQHGRPQFVPCRACADRFSKPRLHMSHFKRTRPGTEPVYTIGAGYRANSIINMAALNLRHEVPVLFAFLRFRRCHIATVASLLRPRK